MLPRAPNRGGTGWFTPRRVIYVTLSGLAVLYLLSISQLQQTSSTEILLLESDRKPKRIDKRIDSPIQRATTKPTSAPITNKPVSPPTNAPVTNSPTSSPKAQHAVSGLSCAAHGGPDDASEMVYWRDIPEDTTYRSPLSKPYGEELYFTFEPDEGGWNNIRMALETAIALAFSMGRTLVLPPKMKFYLLGASQKTDENVITYDSFFHIDSIAAEHSHFKIISFEEYLLREAVPGKLKNRFTGKVSYPPENRTDWSSIQLANFQSTRGGLSKTLWEWVRNVTQPLEWNDDICVASIPSHLGNATTRMEGYLKEVLALDEKEYADVGQQQRPFRRMMRYNGRPTPVDGSPVDRLRELIVDRRKLCVYDQYQTAKTVHGVGETSTGFRLLVHWYAYIFFEDWKQDVHMKRFLRDHFRYRDEIQCAAARIVQEVRRIAMAHGNTPEFDAMHVRRGDFQYKQMHISAEDMYRNNTKRAIPDGRTVYIATDERNLTFFAPLAQRYNVVFMSNFTHLIQGVNPNYYGMLEQLVTAKGKVFFGAYFSTFTGYINRLRGYHAQKEKADRYKEGFIDSYYYVPDDMQSHRDSMRTYSAVRKPFWAQEYAVGWTDIDHGATV